MVNIKKYGNCTCVPTHRKLCVHSSHTTKSQTASSTALLNYPKIFPLKYTTKCRFGKYIYNYTKQCKIIYMLVYFKYLMLRSLRKTCRTRNDLEIASQENYKLRFTIPTILISQYQRTRTSLIFLKKSVAGRYFIKTLLLRCLANPCTTRYISILRIPHRERDETRREATTRSEKRRQLT